MTDQVNVSPGHIGEPLENALTFRIGGVTDGWVIPDTEVLIADIRSELDAGPYNAFAESHSASSFDVTIDTGEAVVGGVPLARDVTTTVTLASNTVDQTVYVGWANESRDTIIIGKSGAFNADNPKIPIWDFDTDGSGVTASTDNRDFEESVDVTNDRYETADGSGTVVDHASVADDISGSDTFLKSNQNDVMDGILGLAGSGALVGNLGEADGEIVRMGSGTSDTVVSGQGGHGRFAITWNAYYDNTNNVWRTITADEPHAHIGFNSGSPSDWGVNDETLTFAVAPPNAAAGDTVNWKFFEMWPDDIIEFSGMELQDFRLDNRASRPSNPEPGRIFYNTTKD